MLSLTQRLAILHELAESGTAVGLKIFDESLEQIAMPPSVEELDIGIPAWTPEELGQSFGEVVPQDRAAGLAMVTQAMSSGVGRGRVHFVDDPDSESSLCMVNMLAELGVLVSVHGGSSRLLESVTRQRSRTLSQRRLVHRRDAAGRFVEVDENTELVLGWTPDELIGNTALEYVHPDDLNRFVEGWFKILEGEIPSPTRVRYLDKRGDPRWFEMQHTDRLSDPEFAHVETQLIDVHDEMLALARARAGESQFTTLTELLPVGVLQVDALGSVVYLNRWLLDLADLSDLSPGDELAWISPISKESFRAALMSAAFKGVSTNMEIVVPAPSGEHDYTCLSRIRPLFDCGEPVGAIASVADVTESRNLQKRLRVQAETDPLTGLPNRRALTAWLVALDDETEQSDRSMAAFFVDLDGFKLVNDGLGHVAGDELLVEVVNRISGSLRPDDLLARVGGDEFVVVCPGISDDVVIARTAERILAAVEGPVILGGSAASVRASVGIATRPSVPAGGVFTEANEVVANADLAMYEAKRLGGHRWSSYRSELRKGVRRRFRVETDLRPGIHSGQFQNYLQPVFNLETNELVAAEALVRWNHPTLGLLAPEHFIPIAERSGAIRDLGAWLLDDAMRIGGELVKRTSGSRVAVNVSVRQLEQPEFVELVLANLAAHDLAPQRLVLEVTETVFVGNNENVLFTLTSLAERGVQIALDDFGTGFSSLNHLRLMPAQIVKIDRSYTRDIGIDHGTTAIVASMVNLTRQLGQMLIVEGIEEHRQLELLLEMGVQTGQGFLLGKPMPEDLFLGEFDTAHSSV